MSVSSTVVGHVVTMADSELLKQWRNTKGDLVRRLPMGGGMLKSDKRRKLTHAEIETRAVEARGGH